MPRNYKRKTDKGLGGRYTIELLNSAIAEIRSGGISLSGAAKKYKIPKSTLLLKTKGWKGREPADKGVPGGGRLALPQDQEVRLARNLKTMSKWGFGLLRKEVLDIVQEFVSANKIRTPFKNNRPGPDWYLSFTRRHRLSLKKAELIESKRLGQQRDPFIIYDFFSKLENLYRELNLYNKPENIWNADETGFNHDPRNTKVVTGIGELAQRQTAGSGRMTTTVLACVNASGQKLPPLILFKGKRLWDNMFGDKEYPDTSYYVSENGWMTENVFFLWFKNVFIAKCTSRPALLIYDGHLSHISTALIELAIEENVTILKLPPHISALLQPLDVSTFKGLKSSWDTLLTEWQRNHIGQSLSKSEFSNLLGAAWYTIKEISVINGFKKTGIYPLCEEEIPRSSFYPEKLRRYDAQLITNSNESNTGLVTLSTENNDIYREEPSTSSLQLTTDFSREAYEPVVEPLQKQRNIADIPTTSLGLTSEEPSTSFEEILLRKVKSKDTTPKTKKTRIDVAEVITTKGYLNHLKIKKEKKMPASRKTKNVKNATPNTAKKRSRKPATPTESSSEDNFEIPFAETDDDNNFVSDVSVDELMRAVDGFKKNFV